jgi:hypothetical protein
MLRSQLLSFIKVLAKVYMAIVISDTTDKYYRIYKNVSYNLQKSLWVCTIRVLCHLLQNCEYSASVGACVGAAGGAYGGQYAICEEIC